MLIKASGNPKNINWGAIGKVARLQCIDFALATVEGTLFMNRSFGWDMPIAEPVSPELETLMASEVFELIHDNFEDVTFKNIDFEYNKEMNKVMPILEVNLEDGEI